MPKSDNQKSKILYIQDHLKRESSRERPVSSAALIEMLKKHGIHADRKTIGSDVRTLMDFYDQMGTGESIQMSPGRNGGYYFNTRRFTASEIDLLINAVQSSRYLTQKMSTELINKLMMEASRTDTHISRNVFVQGRVKSMNDSIHKNVNAIQRAINEARCINFRYFDLDLTKNRVYRNKDYIGISPYALCQNGENCYLIAMSPRHPDAPTHYRVDRMDDIHVTSLKRMPCKELTGKALNEYIETLFNMYGGEVRDVKLRFKRKLVNVVLDEFADSMLIPDGEEWFCVTAKIRISDQFLSWVIGLGTDAQILYPADVAQRCRDLCRKVMDFYDQV